MDEFKGKETIFVDNKGKVFEVNFHIKSIKVEEIPGPEIGLRLNTNDKKKIFLPEGDYNASSMLEKIGSMEKIHNLQVLKNYLVVIFKSSNLTGDFLELVPSIYSPQYLEDMQFPINQIKSIMIVKTKKIVKVKILIILDV